MGAVHNPNCRSCGHAWQNELVGALMFAGAYRCTGCSRVQMIGADRIHTRRIMPKRRTPNLYDLPDRIVDRMLGRCGCGGSYRPRAPVRCPECNSDDVDLGEVMAYAD